jgi:hypothetical protein
MEEVKKREPNTVAVSRSHHAPRDQDYVRLDDPLSCHLVTGATPRQIPKSLYSVYNAEGGNRTLTPEGTRF